MFICHLYCSRYFEVWTDQHACVCVCPLVAEKLKKEGRHEIFEQETMEELEDDGRVSEVFAGARPVWVRRVLARGQQRASRVRDSAVCARRVSGHSERGILESAT